MGKINNYLWKLPILTQDPNATIPILILPKLTKDKTESKLGCFGKNRMFLYGDKND